jgi:hypothetical protein
MRKGVREGGVRRMTPPDLAGQINAAHKECLARMEGAIDKAIAARSP